MDTGIRTRSGRTITKPSNHINLSPCAKSTKRFKTVSTIKCMQPDDYPDREFAALDEPIEPLSPKHIHFKEEILNEEIFNNCSTPNIYTCIKCGDKFDHSKFTHSVIVCKKCCYTPTQQNNIRIRVKKEKQSVLNKDIPEFQHQKCVLCQTTRLVMSSIANEGIKLSNESCYIKIIEVLYYTKIMNSSLHDTIKYMIDVQKDLGVITKYFRFNACSNCFYEVAKYFFESAINH